ncbi:MAG: hypothetical protein P1V35_10615 [Planctomycetota bacterium]|nr:hypothetical protein [Planctomycetota bacterium]
MGSLSGVLDTESAWIGKREVVEVKFDPAQISYAKLVEFAVANSCDQWIYATTDEQLAIASKAVPGKVERFSGKPRAAKDSDQLYYLRKSLLRYLALTPAQARRVNGAMGLGQDPKVWLSPRQLAQIPAITKALAEESNPLRELKRPGQLLELAAYERELRQALEKKSE